MLQKWKNILTNWINCYLESDVKVSCVTLDSLLYIIIHLRDNLNLDESRSSILEANTVEDFLKEKYPEFAFPDGTIEANTDEELYVVASLLLLFVCVNSKNVDIKSAMCSKLSIEDQEVILKFSKCMMECSPITYRDVQAAITDSCGPETDTAAPVDTRSTVSETPPALRSLHSEVRRLQAALDAERFDRNYLQEELARTNLKVEKLSKDKEHHKLEILNLKAKISMCCGQESEARAGDEAAEETTKLMKELHKTEERLVETQGQLDETLHERDTYKAKVNQLKQERDKWLNLRQQEATRVVQLSEELNVERRQAQSLRELVEELRQHQRLNSLDSSQVECDDPDASVHSFQHNSSICSEACVNVVEVQLNEERAKIVILNQQLQSLQGELNELMQKSETEIHSLSKIITEKDDDIFNLKHRINEEIESKNKQAMQYSDENSRLVNDINELEQKLKDNNNQYRLMFESKMYEIQTLQEEKLSLCQSLSDRTTKLEGVIKSLKSEIAAERDSKLKMKEDYENHIITLNEKVLNRNNELVELQNNVFDKSEQIESLQLEFRKEKQAKDEIIEKYQNELRFVNNKKIEAENMLVELQNNVLEKSELNESLHLQLRKEQQAKEELIEKYYNELRLVNNKKIEAENMLVELQNNVLEKSEQIESLHLQLRKEKQAKDEIIEKYQNELRLVNNKKIEAENMLVELQNNVLEKSKQIESLHMQLRKEEQAKEEFIEKYHNELQLVNHKKIEAENMLVELKNNVLEKSEQNESLHLQLRKEEQAKEEFIEKYHNELQLVNNKKIEAENMLVELQNEVFEKSGQIESLHLEFQKEKQAKDEMIEKYQNELQLVNNNKIEAENMLVELKNNVLEKSEQIESLHLQLRKEEQAKEEFIEKYHNELQLVNNKKIEAENMLVELKNNVLEKSEQNESLHLQLRKEQQAKEEFIEKYHNEMQLVNNKKIEAENMLVELKNNVLEKSEQNESIHLQLRKEQQAKEELIEKYHNELQLVNNKKIEAETMLVELQNEVLEKSEHIESLHLEFRKEKQAKDEIIEKYHNELLLVNNKKIEAENMLVELKNNVLEKSEQIESLHLQLRKEEQAKEEFIEKNYNELQLVNNKKIEAENMLVELKNDVLEKSEQNESLHLQLRKEEQAKEEFIEKYHNEMQLVNNKKIEAENMLVELQNEVLEKSEHIESLHLQLRKEEQAKEELIEKYHKELELVNNKKIEAENILQQKNDEVESLMDRLNNNYTYTEEVNRELHSLKNTMLQLSDKCKNLEETRDSLNKEVEIRNKKLDEQCKEIENFRKMLSEDRISYEKHMDHYETKVATLTKNIKETCKEMSRQKDTYTTVLESRERDIQTLQQENRSLVDEVNDVKHQLELKVHSLKEKLTDNENLTEKLKTSYECQIENLNVMVTKLTNYLKDKTIELDSLRKDREQLQKIIDGNSEVIKNLEEEVLSQKNNCERLISEFDSERLVLKNMVTVTESVMEDQRSSLNEIISNHVKNIETLKEDFRDLQHRFVTEKAAMETKQKESETTFEGVVKELSEEKMAKEKIEKELDNQKQYYIAEINKLMEEIGTKESKEVLESQNKELTAVLRKCSDELSVLKKEKNDLGNEVKIFKDQMESLTFQLSNLESRCKDLEHDSQRSRKVIAQMREHNKTLVCETNELKKQLESKCKQIEELQMKNDELERLLQICQKDKNLIDESNKALKIENDLQKSKFSNKISKIMHEHIILIKKLESEIQAKNRDIEIEEELLILTSKIEGKTKYNEQLRLESYNNNAKMEKLMSDMSTNVIELDNQIDGNGELVKYIEDSQNEGIIEDLENFMVTIDKHLRECFEKQVALQKERDRLTEVNRINKSELLNLKKFVSELFAGFKKFGNIKDLYTQKLSRVVSVQRMVRREILSLDGYLNSATMCKLERSYAAVMQDLSECVMNLERWVERSISKTISPENIKQTLNMDDDRASIASTTFQNTGLEMQLEDLENSFQKLLEEVVRAQKGEGVRDAQSVTVMEVRAEYEDKLNRMKAKMKQLYQEQISIYEKKQREEIHVLERELTKTREKFAESSKAYEEHIKALTTELWRVGEKFLTKKDELEWERKQQRSGSLMSLQHVHSSGLVAPREQASRISDAHSLRSLPVHNNTNKREGRGLHMSDEEGEVFDNRWLKELSSTPTRGGRNSPARLSELRWRNSLCPPHLKSSYPAETQFAPAIDEEDIKCIDVASQGGRYQRKEVGITAYKKPGPPTPSKQAGRLSATDSDLRESLRMEPEPQISRKTSTPSRLRSLFRSNKNDTAEGTPRSRRLSIFRKK